MNPADEREVAEAVAAAREPIAISGGGTRPVGNPATETVPLVTSALCGVKLYEPGALTLVASAGTPVSEIHDLLDSNGQQLAFEPIDHRGLLNTAGEPTIGGMAASNASGPRRIREGACRDYMIGVRFVNGEGAIVKSGGRVMKNVTGYDLVKLMAGSFGTLGILTEVAFKVLPAAETRAVLLIEGLSVEDAVSAMSSALCSPFDVTGAAHVPEGMDGDPVTMIRIEGFVESVRYRAGKLQELLRKFGEADVERDPSRTEAGWKWIRDVQKFHGRDGDVWRVSVKPTDSPRLARRIRDQQDASFVFDWGGGLVWILVTPGTDLRLHLSGIAGHATLIRASRETRLRLPVFQPQSAAIAKLSEGLRRKFDPRGILNPGLMA